MVMEKNMSKITVGSCPSAFQYIVSRWGVATHNQYSQFFATKDEGQQKNLDPDAHHPPG
jgi:hypothetical protein